METTFATVVDEIRQLSFDEKKELAEIIERDLLEERRSEILKDCADSAKEYEDGSLVFSTDVTELMRSLDD
ncbi:MAG: hypothetical protein R2682_04230 [Pyrinomonadaceae bacterium]